MIPIIEWTVIHWDKLWRTLWYPTANIELWSQEIDDWVYKTNVIIDNALYKAAGSVNNRKWVFEVHIFDFSQDIYWKKIKAYALDKIRDNKKFSSLEDLKEQIKLDTKAIKEKQNYVLTFGTFDLVHEWHKYYLEKAKAYWDKLVTIIATDKNVEKFKKNTPINNQEKRAQDIKELAISDIVCIWEEVNPMTWVDLYHPSVVCLWYDQTSFSDMLIDYIKKNKLNTQVIRLEPYKPEIYKSSKIKK